MAKINDLPLLSNPTEDMYCLVGKEDLHKVPWSAIMGQIGAPYIATTVAGMTDKTRVYVYQGSESGYTSGNWYYWNGSAWTSGGTYNSAAVNTDKTLTQSDKPADSAVVGKKIGSLKEDKVDKPSAADDGKMPRAKEGEVEWVEVGQPTDEQTNSAVSSWLNDHPEATTTVKDESIEEIKINKNFLPWIKKDYVTPEMFGALGDGLTNDTEAFIKCIQTGKIIQLDVGKTYVLSDINSNLNYIVRGIGFHNEYEPSETMPKIKGLIITGTEEWTKQCQTFENIEFENCTFDNLCKTSFNYCQFRNSTIRNIRGGRVTNCFFNDCQSAIDGLADSMITFSTFTNCKECCIRGGSSSLVIGNRFQWSKLGLDLTFSQDLIVQGNWFDRNENAINMINESEVSIVGNVFKRSINSHIKGKVNNCVVNDNKFIYARINDDEEGEIGPLSSFDLTLFDNSTFVGNKILNKPENNRIFKDSIGIRTDTNSIYGNIVNNSPLEIKTKRIPFTAGEKNIFQLNDIIEKNFYASTIDFSIFSSGGFFATPEVIYNYDGIYVSCPTMETGNKYMLNVKISYRDISVF